MWAPKEAREVFLSTSNHSGGHLERGGKSQTALATSQLIPKFTEIGDLPPERLDVIFGTGRFKSRLFPTLFSFRASVSCLKFEISKIQLYRLILNIG